MKNSCVGTQLTEYNRLYKENSAIYHDVCNRFGLSDSTFWILYILRTEEPPITQSDICVALSSPGRPSTHRSKSWNARAYSRSPATAGGTASLSA